MLKVLIAAGGTGGHLFPANELAKVLSLSEVHFAGHHLTNSPFFDRKFEYTEISSSSTLRKWPLIVKGFFQSIKLMIRYKPDVVVGFGSFHTLPILMAAFICRKKIVLFEPNCTFGKVNGLFAPFAEKIACFFPLPTKKMVCVPFLPWNLKEKTKSEYVKDPNLFTILVFGGSQGAEFINKTFCKAAKLLKFPIRVIHLTGKEDPEIKYECKSIVKPFESDMASVYHVADMVVCRCGAGTIAELILHQKPAIVIPYPHAHNHQKENGKHLGKAVKMLLQEETNPEILAFEIADLKNDLEKYKEHFKRINRPSTIDFKELIRKVGEKK